MKVLARIPALDVAAITIAGVAGPPAGEPTGPAEAPMPPATMNHGTPRSRVRPPRSRFPSTSVVALAVLAAVAWSLASWSDAQRAARSRLERLARLQPVAAPETISR